MKKDNRTAKRQKAKIRKRSMAKRRSKSSGKLRKKTGYLQTIPSFVRKLSHKRGKPSKLLNDEIQAQIEMIVSMMNKGDPTKALKIFKKIYNRASDKEKKVIEEMLDSSFVNTSQLTNDNNMGSFVSAGVSPRKLRKVLKVPNVVEKDVQLHYYQSPNNKDDTSPSDGGENFVSLAAKSGMYAINRHRSNMLRPFRGIQLLLKMYTYGYIKVYEDEFCVIFQNVYSKTLLLSIRGTEKKSDWINYNWKLLQDYEKSFLKTDMVKRAKEVTSTIIYYMQENAGLKKYNLVLSGHSLGGAVVIAVLDDDKLGDHIHSVYAFNPGTPPSAIIKSNKCLTNRQDNSWCRNRHKLRIYTINKDLISLASVGLYAGEINVYETPVSWLKFAERNNKPLYHPSQIFSQYGNDITRVDSRKMTPPPHIDVNILQAAHK